MGTFLMWSQGDILNVVQQRDVLQRWRVDLSHLKRKFKIFSCREDGELGPVLA
jgi:hypothetical protein